MSRRKIATLGAAGLLSLAGIGGVISHTAAHASTHARVTAPDTGGINLQSGSQTQDTTGVDTEKAGAPEASAESTAPHAADAPGGLDVQGTGGTGGTDTGGGN